MASNAAAEETTDGPGPGAGQTAHRNNDKTYSCGELLLKWVLVVLIMLAVLACMVVSTISTLVLAKDNTTIANGTFVTNYSGALVPLSDANTVALWLVLFVPSAFGFTRAMVKEGLSSGQPSPHWTSVFLTAFVSVCEVSGLWLFTFYVLPDDSVDISTAIVLMNSERQMKVKSSSFRQQHHHGSQEVSERDESYQRQDTSSAAQEDTKTANVRATIVKNFLNMVILVIALFVVPPHGYNVYNGFNSLYLRQTEVMLSVLPAFGGYVLGVIACAMCIQLFWFRHYTGLFTGQHMLLNRTKAPEHPTRQSPGATDLHGLVMICTTMYRETWDEMSQYLESIQKVATSQKLGEEYNWTGKFEAHVCPLYIHLKDNQEVKSKKRWSQVMYMESAVDRFDDSEVKYILATDGDVDFECRLYCSHVDADAKRQAGGSRRGLCTDPSRRIRTFRLVKAGWKVNYCAGACDSTHCPEEFDEFWKQRRRWIPSTLANQILLLKNWKTINQNNKYISMIFLLFQIVLLLSTVISPSTCILIVTGGLYYGVGVPTWLSFVLFILLTLVFALICMYYSQETQLKVAKILCFVFLIAMAIAVVGTASQMAISNTSSAPRIANDNGKYKGCYQEYSNSGDLLLPNAVTRIKDLTNAKCMSHCHENNFYYSGTGSPGTACFCGPQQALENATRLQENMCASPCPGDSGETCGGRPNQMSVYEINRLFGVQLPVDVTTLYIAIVAGIHIVAALLHPRELTCIFHGVVYLFTLPCVYILMNVYSVCNLTDQSWGTREAKSQKEQSKESFLDDVVAKMRQCWSFCRRSYHKLDESIEEEPEREAMEDEVDGRIDVGDSMSSGSRGHMRSIPGEGRVTACRSCTCVLCMCKVVASTYTTSVRNPVDLEARRHAVAVQAADSSPYEPVRATRVPCTASLHALTTFERGVQITYLHTLRNREPRATLASPSPHFLKNVADVASHRNVEIYEPMFTREGYTDTSFIAGMSDEDLKDIGVADLHDRNDFRRHIRKLHQDEPDIDIRVPDNVETWLTMISLDTDEYKEKFRRAFPEGTKAQIVFQELKTMTEDRIVHKLGVQAKGHLRRLKLAITRIRQPTLRCCEGESWGGGGWGYNCDFKPFKWNSGPCPVGDSSTRGLCAENVEGEERILKAKRDIDGKFQEHPPDVIAHSKKPYLDPTTEQFRLDQNKEDEFKQNLQQLRNSYLLTYLVANSVWLVLMFTLVQHAELQVINTNPLGLVFLVTFTFVLGVQFAALVIHRLATFIQYVSRIPTAISAMCLNINSGYEPI
ncbi:hypothetical protein Bbelb_316240 [Branchiostoma belcheri]|nr:hypothetical protein Bbelb_316240 [Branchiostoma belcheri]